MEKPIVILGIDVSKKTLDVCELIGQEHHYAKWQNDYHQVKKHLKKFDPSNTIIAMEHTGAYNNALFDVLSEINFRVYVFNPYHLKHSLGMMRRKNDKIDAFRIASYTQRNEDLLTPWQPPRPVVRALKGLLSERQGLIRARRRVKAAIQENTSKFGATQAKRTKRRRQRQIKDYNQYIAEIEKDIREVIRSDKELKRVFKLANSVPGIGEVTAWSLIAKTNGFKTITDPRKLACYAGVAPFEHQSGTSINKPPKVSHMADKKLKTVLHMAAMRVTRLDGELREYYIRKVAEGKHKMAVLNAIRNKLIHRVLAVVKRGEPYQIIPPKTLSVS